MSEKEKSDTKLKACCAAQLVGHKEIKMQSGPSKSQGSLEGKDANGSRHSSAGRGKSHESPENLMGCRRREWRAV